MWRGLLDISYLDFLQSTKNLTKTNTYVRSNAKYFKMSLKMSFGDIVLARGRKIQNLQKVVSFYHIGVFTIPVLLMPYPTYWELKGVREDAITSWNVFILRLRVLKHNICSGRGLFKIFLKMRIIFLHFRWKPARTDSD